MTISLKTFGLKTFGLGLALGFSVALAAPASAANLKMMTGPQGGSWIPLGGQLKDMWEKAVPGLQVQVLPGAGIANVRGVDEGKADIGFGNSISTVDGVARQEAVPKKRDQCLQHRHALSAILSARGAADAGINKIADLKGKAITTQQRGNTGELITRQILEVNGIKLQRRQGELRRLFRLGEPDEGRPRRRLRPRHAGAGRRHHGSRLGAADQAARSVVELRRHEEAQPRLHAGDHQEGQLSEAGRRREGDRLRHPHLRLLQAAGGRGLHHDQGGDRQHRATSPASPRRSASSRWPTSPPISACRSIPAPPSTTRNTASP